MYKLTDLSISIQPENEEKKQSPDLLYTYI